MISGASTFGGVIAKPGAAAEVLLKVDGKNVALTTVKRTVPAAFSASEIPRSYSITRLHLALASFKALLAAANEA